MQSKRYYSYLMRWKIQKILRWELLSWWCARRSRIFMCRPGEGNIIVLFQTFKKIISSILCRNCSPNYGDRFSKYGDRFQKLGTTSLSRALVTLHLRGSRPRDPRFCFCFVFYWVFVSFLFFERSEFLIGTPHKKSLRVCPRARVK